MTNTPAFSKVDADRILKRAAEIEGTEDPKPLTVDELRSIADEAGFGRDALERAIAEAKQAARVQTHHPISRRGLVITRLSTIRSIPVDLTSEQLMQAIRLLHPYREGSAQVKLEADRITWRDRKGIVFGVRLSSGVTELRVHVTKVLVRKGRWMWWVKTAADRLESLIYLVAARRIAAPAELDAHLLDSGPASRDGNG